MNYDAEQFHLDVEARLLSLPSIRAVSILREQPGVTDQDVFSALQTLNARSGKMGACVLIPNLEENVQDKDTPGPQLLLKLTLQAITDALTNLDPQEGTIKDLRTVQRMNIALQTNVAQARGFARWQRQQRSLAAFPAQRLVRQRLAKQPREDWPERFAQAVEDTYYKGANIEDMSALINHPCWIALSVFNNPYPPYDFGSGMGLQVIDEEEAQELGLLPGPEADPEHAEMMQPQSRGLNEALEASPRVTEQKLREALSAQLAGFAQWEGKRLVFTDPNGSRPISAPDLARLWKTPLPEQFADLPGGGHLQRQAFIDWVRDHGSFENKGHTDRYEDIQRLLARLQPTGRESGPLHRGLSYTTPERRARFLSDLQRAGYVPRQGFPAESWTLSEPSSSAYSKAKPYPVILRLEKGHSKARDVAPLTREFAAEIKRGVVPQGKTPELDDEVLLPASARFRVRSIQQDQQTTVVFLEERK